MSDRAKFKRIWEINLKDLIYLFQSHKQSKLSKRQTAMIAFGKIDEIKNVYMHYGPFNETMDEHTDKLKKKCQI